MEGGAGLEFSSIVPLNAVGSDKTLEDTELSSENAAVEGATLACSSNSNKVSESDIVWVPMEVLVAVCASTAAL